MKENKINLRKSGDFVHWNYDKRKDVIIINDFIGKRKERK